MQYLVVMHRGQKLSANMLPGVKIISLEDSGLDLMRLVVSGDGIDTEKAAEIVEAGCRDV